MMQNSKIFEFHKILTSHSSEKFLFTAFYFLRWTVILIFQLFKLSQLLIFDFFQIDVKAFQEVHGAADIVVHHHILLHERHCLAVFLHHVLDVWR